jgi:hypothetical protein
MPTNFIHPTKKLGKRAPRLDSRTFKLSRYLTPALLPPPPAAGYFGKVPTWPMYMNDTLGDCVIAAAGHMVQEWTANAGTEVTLPDSAILAGYEVVGGYVPGNASTDNGCDILTALKYWKSTGFGGHKIVAFVSVDLLNQTELEQAIYIFGNVYAGFALPLSVQSTTAWKMPAGGLNGDGSPGSWGGHCVPLVGYNSGPNSGVTVVTWGELLWASWRFVRHYADEGYAIVTQDWLNAVGDSPTGFDLAQLQTDLAAL